MNIFSIYIHTYLILRIVLRKKIVRLAVFKFNGPAVNTGYLLSHDQLRTIFVRTVRRHRHRGRITAALNAIAPKRDEQLIVWAIGPYGDVLACIALEETNRMTPAKLISNEFLAIFRGQLNISSNYSTRKFKLLCEYTDKTL